ncbi:MAG: hypothetical protein KOO62_11445 [candidate division Zixibacteria bacterium]|nr:hypothetical protein [candidate division Zixibacteria bacterium]
MDKYSHRERIEMIIAGEKPDRFAASFWRHFFHQEHYAAGTAEAMIGFQKELDWDFVKVNPRADFHVEDWGLALEWSHNEFKKHRKVSFPIQQIEDWDKIGVNGLNAPSLAEHLQMVSLVRKGLGKEVPILMTVFTPLSIAGRMVPDRQLLVEHLRNEPARVHRALKAITETFSAYATELRNAGADGLFYATCQWASSDLITWNEYQEFGIPYDLAVIEATDEDAINLLHVCDSNNYLSRLADIDYRCQLYNWDCLDETNLSIAEGSELLGQRPVVGGVAHESWLWHGSPDEVVRRLNQLKREHSSARFIVGPGCAIPPEVPIANLHAIRESL